MSLAHHVARSASENSPQYIRTTYAVRCKERLDMRRLSSTSRPRRRSNSLAPWTCMPAERGWRALRELTSARCFVLLALHRQPEGGVFSSGRLSRRAQSGRDALHGLAAVHLTWNRPMRTPTINLALHIRCCSHTTHMHIRAVSKARYLNTWLGIRISVCSG